MIIIIMIIIIITDNIHNTVIIMKIIDFVFYVLILPFFGFYFFIPGKNASQWIFNLFLS